MDDADTIELAAAVAGKTATAAERARCLALLDEAGRNLGNRLIDRGAGNIFHQLREAIESGKDPRP